MKFFCELNRSTAVLIGLIVTTGLVLLQHEIVLSLLDNLGMLAASLGPPQNPWKVIYTKASLSYNMGVKVERKQNPGLDTRRFLALHPELNEKQNLMDHHQHRNAQQQQQPNYDQQKPDATFNGIPLVYHQGKPRSSVYCIEEGGSRNGHHDNSNVSWMFRSCRFEYLCFDVDRQDYVLFRNGGSGGNDEKNDMNQHHPQSTMFSDLPPDNWTLSVALGGINPRWLDQRGFDKGAWKVRWFPTILPPDDALDGAGYYALPDNHVLAPFHSFAGHNVGHLLWDDFYPIFSLLRIFNLLPRQGKEENDNFPNSPLRPTPRSTTQLVPIRHRLSQQLYAACDIRKNKRKQCADNFERFLPLMGVDPAHFSTTKDFQLQAGQEEEKNLKSNYVCAKTAIAGLGMLTDHGLRDHGWVIEEKESLPSDLPGVFRRSLVAQALPPHNLGRGANFAAFSKFLVHNLLGDRVDPLPSLATPTTPLQVTFSILSSRDWDRRLNFTRQVKYLQEHWNEHDDDDDDDKTTLPPLRVEAHALWNMTLKEQVMLAQRSHIFVTVCGGGSMTATFLPPFSTLIIYYNPTGGFDFQSYSRTGRAARLDWDLLNNAAHLRVHWLPIPAAQQQQQEQQENGGGGDNGMNHHDAEQEEEEEDNLELLLALIQHEAVIIKRESQF